MNTTLLNELKSKSIEEIRKDLTAHNEEDILLGNNSWWEYQNRKMEPYLYNLISSFEEMILDEKIEMISHFKEIGFAWSRLVYKKDLVDAIMGTEEDGVYLRDVSKQEFINLLKEAKDALDLCLDRSLHIYKQGEPYEVIPDMSTFGEWSNEGNYCRACLAGVYTIYKEDRLANELTPEELVLDNLRSHLYLRSILTYMGLKTPEAYNTKYSYSSINPLDISKMLELVIEVNKEVSV